MKVFLTIMCLAVGANALKYAIPFRSQPKGHCPPPNCPPVDPPTPIYAPDLDDCSSFYVCSNGKPYHFTCPADLKFNTQLNVCDYAENVQCPTGCSTITCPPVDGEQSVYFPDPTNCGAFYQCSNGVPYHVDCPSGLHFNPNLNVCDWPQDANCSSYKFV